MRKKYLSLLLVFAILLFNFAPAIPQNTAVAATRISKVNITLQAPVVGDKINKVMESYQGYEYDRPDKDAVASVPSNSGCKVDGANYIIYNSQYGNQGYYYGTFQANTDYYVSIGISPNSGYTMDDNTVFTVNGQAVLMKGGYDNGMMVFTKIRAVNKYNVSFNFNGGTNKGLSITSPVVQGTAITLPSVTSNNVTPPSGKTFDAFEINGTRYNAGSKYTVNANTTIKLLWKDIPTQAYTYDIKIANYDSVPSYGKAMPKYTITFSDSKIVENNTKVTGWKKQNSSTSVWENYNLAKASSGWFRYEISLKVKKIDASSNVKLYATTPSGKKVEIPITKIDSTSNSSYTYIQGYINTTKTVDKANALKGDINLDGIINADDAAEAIEIFKTNAQTAENKALGDMNDDGKVDAEDAALIIEYFKTHK